jgi:hypothetical protein
MRLFALASPGHVAPGPSESTLFTVNHRDKESLKMSWQVF